MIDAIFALLPLGVVGAVQIERRKTVDTTTYLEHIKNGTVPPEPPRVASSRGNTYLTGSSMESYKYRDECIARGLWTVIDRVWTAKLAGWIGNRTVLEIMAGAGWIAKALTELGINVTATDDFSWSDQHSKMELVFPVQKKDAAVACLHSNADILLVSWAPYGDEAICRACEVWGSDRPIIYIGESEGGCNAPDEFFEHFKELTDAPEIPLMSWWGLHDGCFIGFYTKGD